MRIDLPDPGPRSGALLALAAGALTPLAFAPFNLWICSIVGPAALLWALLHTSTRTAFLRGWLYGAGFYGTGVSWVYVSIHEFGYAPVWLAGGLTVLFVLGLAFMPALLAWLWRRGFTASAPALLFGFPGIWILIEWMRYWLLSGFPWNYLGYAHLETPLSGWAPIGGVYALSWIAACSAAALLIFLRREYSLAARIGAGSLLLILWAGGWHLQGTQWTSPKPLAALDVALVQGNIAQDLKWQPDQIAPTLEIYRQLSLANRQADLIIWPEAAVPVFMHKAKPWLDDIAAEASRTDTGIITGIPYWGINPARPDTPIMHNSILGLGNASGLYHKRKLVPFGEYVPFESVLRGLIRFLDLPMSAFSAGGPQQQGLFVGSGANEIRIAPYICYEVVYPDFVARTYGNADVLLTISNDAWFGGSTGPAQHLQIAQMRALELGREMLRATNNGLTAIIDSTGRVRARAAQFERTVLTGTVQAYEGQTPYSRWGSGGALVLGLILALLTRRIRSSGEDAASGGQG